MHNALHVQTEAFMYHLGDKLLVQINARISNLFQFFTDKVFQVEILWESQPIKERNYANDHENHQQ